MGIENFNSSERSVRLEEIERFRNVFNDVKSFSELYNLIDELGTLPGTAKQYTSEELKSLVDGAVDGSVSLRFIPRTGGMRRKIMELIGEHEEDGVQAA